MSQVYRYRHFFRSATYRLSEDGVEVESKVWGRFHRTFVSYDKLPHRSSTQTYSSKPLKTASIIFFIFTVIIVISQFTDKSPEPLGILLWASFFVLCYSLYLMGKVTSEVYSYEGNHLSFFRSRLTESKLANFIQELDKAKFDFFDRRLKRRASETSPADATRYLLYLLETGIISEDSYERLRLSITANFDFPDNER